MKIVGQIAFGGHVLNVYESLDAPLFIAIEIAKLIDYSAGKTHQMLEVVEHDEKVLKTVDVADIMYRSDTPHSHARKTQTTWFVTELGLYNILAQSRKPIARGWRRIVHEELIDMRKANGRDIQQQFEVWDEKYSDLYFDEKTGMIMQSITVPGGDVEQVPYEMEDE